nr:hypothetical protein BaRGS_029687 [Batillaria attramentaria]
MELASLEEFLGMCGEFEKEQDYIVLKSSRSEKGPSARSSPSPRRRRVSSSNFVVSNPCSRCRRVEAAAQDCIEVLVEAGDFVAPERITRLLLQRYGVNDLRDLGVPNVRFPYQIECINQHQRMISKVNASMEAFVNARSMCTLYELQESLREYTTDNAPFETLQLGPLQCLPDVYKLFKFPQDEMIPEITTSELLEVLSEYLSKHQKWTAKLDMQEVMAFFVEHYGVTSAYSLGIRIRSLPLAAQVLKKSHRDAAATRRSIITRFKANIENEVAEAFNKVKVTIMQRDDDGSMEVRRHYAQMTAEAVLMEMMQKFRILLSIDVPQSKAEHKRHHMLDAAVRQFLSVMQAEPLGRALLHLAVCVGSHDIQEAASMLSAPRQAEEAAAEGRGGGSGAAQTEKPKTSQPPSKAALMEKLKRYVERCLAQGTLTLSHLDRIEEKLLEDFGFPTFVTMGFGRFLHFLLHDHEPKAEADVERALCHQFQVPEVRALGFGNVRHLEWTQPLTDTFVFPPEAVTVVMPQQPAVRDELLGDDDEVVEEEEEESESESEEDDSSSASFLSDDDEDEKKQDEGVQVGAEPTATEGAVKVEDDESSGETDDSSEDDDEDEEEEEEIGEKQDEEQSMTVANASDDEEGEEVEKESDAEDEKTETEEDRCHRLINEIRREEFGVGIELNEDGKRLMRVQQERLGRSLDRLSRDLYTKDTHFVLELVQNADDNSYPEHLMASLEAGSDSAACPSVRFVIEQTGVTVLNNECGFREKDVRALCDVGRSTKGKHKYGYIGQKGIGFKSVFRVTSRPEVHSNGFHLCFDVSSGPMGYILPHWCEDSAPEPE